MNLVIDESSNISNNLLKKRPRILSPKSPNPIPSKVPSTESKESPVIPPKVAVVKYATDDRQLHYCPRCGEGFRMKEQMENHYQNELYLLRNNKICTDENKHLFGWKPWMK